MRKGLVGVLASLVGCFSDPEPAPPDPVEVCTTCAADSCKKHYDACAADPDCASCFAAPKSLECLANTLFQPAANCSCDECASECSYLCPGGQGACDSCSTSNCSTEGSACLADVDCAPCLDDPFLPGCDANPLYMASATCSCESCGQECVWLCPSAGNTCAGCISTSCSPEFTACISDVACNDCFENPSTDGCDVNATYMALTDCLCPATACADVCGILFCTTPA
ncbi:MAG TPA: hypothetical protein VFG69_11990 [Nannocystaceae bacterium]|nr:hypothetical protein [Nannocystaceae bacterium]